MSTRHRMHSHQWAICSVPTSSGISAYLHLTSMLSLTLELVKL